MNQEVINLTQNENEFKQQLIDQEAKFQKEMMKLQTELDDCRSQLTISSLDFQSRLEAETRKYEEELQSLQHLLQEAVDVSSKYEKEIRRLNYTNSKLMTELNELQNIPYSGTASSFSQFSDTDKLDDSMRKVNKYAQEDATVLRSLVVPLEEEIIALKDKLRDMDAELRKYQRNNNNLSSLPDDMKGVTGAKINDSNNEDTYGPISVVDVVNNPSTDSIEEEIPSEKKWPSIVGCEMCANYEEQLLNSQQKIHNLEKHIITLERYKQELTKETAFRKEMEETWNEKKEEYKEEVKSLQSKTEKSEETLKELRVTFEKTYDDFIERIRNLCFDREKNHRELTRLQKENDNLIGKYNKHSQQLQNEFINLPNSVEELQELILRNQEELIATKVAKEQAEEMAAKLTEEVAFVRDQSRSEQQARIELQTALTESMNKLKNDVQLKTPEKSQSSDAHREDHCECDIRKEMKQFSTDLDKLTKNKKYFQDTIGELRSRILSLQTELDNSEKVQKDFVLLSQSLQQELEKIREAETEVRWEHDEDVSDCRKCKTAFSVTRRKVHCKHCGRIFCQSCMTRTVNSGPNNRPSKVCDVCHTLLDRDSAPYFSTVPPQGD